MTPSQVLAKLEAGLVRSVVTLPALAVALAASLGCGAPPGGGAENGNSGGDLAATSTTSSATTETTGSSVSTDAPTADACVEPGRYTVDGTIVIDGGPTGLIWQRAVDETLRSQPDAVAYCAGLELGGRGGFRLPTVQELNALKLRPAGLKGGPGTCYPSIDHAAFPDTPSAEFWTSTTRDAGDALETGFDDGRTHPASLDSTFHVRCVHDSAVTANRAQ